MAGLRRENLAIEGFGLRQFAGAMMGQGLLQLLVGSEGRRHGMGRPGGLAGRRMVSAFQCARLC
jgi:hypothetical protein